MGSNMAAVGSLSQWFTSIVISPFNGRRGGHQILFLQKVWLSNHTWFSGQVSWHSDVKRDSLNRLKEYGLQRRGVPVDEELVRQTIQEELDRSGRLLGYRPIWRKLHSSYGINVPRRVVERLLQEPDPMGSKLRRAHRLRRREYLNPGPNYCWHSTATTNWSRTDSLYTVVCKKLGVVQLFFERIEAPKTGPWQQYNASWEEVTVIHCLE